MKLHTLLYSFISVFFAGYSLTIAAQVIEPPELVCVSIDVATQNVHIFWNASPTAGVIYYRSFEWAVVGENPSPSGVPIQESYTEASDPLHFEYYNDRVGTAPLAFYVRAFITETEASLFSNIDSTVFLTSFFDSCSASIELNWNLYSSWKGNIASQKVMCSTDGITYEAIRTLNGTATQTTITQVQPNQMYHFYIESIRENFRRDSSSSNRVDIDTRMSVYPEYIHAEYGTVTDDHPNVKFTVDTASQLNLYILTRSDSPEGNYDTLEIISSSDKVITYTDEIPASGGAFYYRLQAINHCQEIIAVSENTAGTLFLQTSSSDLNVLMNWNSYYEWLGGVNSYRIERRLSGEPYEELAMSSNTEYEDNSLQSFVNQGVGNEVCYRIVALEGAGNPYWVQSTSTSNESCVQLNTRVRFEYDAFIPDATDNNRFGPVMDFIPQSFSFKIYNRWGMLVFETKDPVHPEWDGHYNGHAVPEGVYRYQLEYRNDEGKPVIKHGKVTVLSL